MMDWSRFFAQIGAQVNINQDLLATYGIGRLWGSKANKSDWSLNAG